MLKDGRLLCEGRPNAESDSLPFWRSGFGAKILNTYTEVTKTLSPQPQGLAAQERKGSHERGGNYGNVPTLIPHTFCCDTWVPVLVGRAGVTEKELEQ